MSQLVITIPRELLQGLDLYADTLQISRETAAVRMLTQHLSGQSSAVPAGAPLPPPEGAVPPPEPPVNANPPSPPAKKKTDKETP